jgi:uncharacterized RDD family membrane protein YckC
MPKKVEEGEQRRLMMRNAGFWIRLGAALLDGIVVGLPLLFVAFLVTQHLNTAETVSNVMMFLYGLIIPVVWGGFTVGKRMCGIRIRKLDGSDPTIGTMILRTVVGGILYSLTFGIGTIVSAFMVGLREDKRAIHDFIAAQRWSTSKQPPAVSRFPLPACG